MAVDEAALETNGDGQRFDVVHEVEEDEDEEEERQREVTSRDFGRRFARALSESEGKRGGLARFWLVGLELLIVVDTAATIAYTKTPVDNISFFQVTSETLILRMLHHNKLVLKPQNYSLC